MYDVWILIQAILEPDDQSFPVLEIKGPDNPTCQAFMYLRF